MFETITFSSSNYEVTLTVTPDAISRAVDGIMDDMFNDNIMYEDSFEYFISENVIEDDDGNEIPETEMDFLIDAAYRDVSGKARDNIRRLMRRDFIAKMDNVWSDTFDD